HAQRSAPMGHRALRIELYGTLKGAESLVVVVGVHECEPLLEVLLRLAARCRHGPRVLTQTRVLDSRLWPDAPVVSNAVTYFLQEFVASDEVFGGQFADHGLQPFMKLGRQLLNLKA